jgi:hypothetical protein
MNDLIEIQFLTCTPIIVLSIVTLRFQLLQKVFHRQELEPEHIRFLQGILVLVIVYLSYLLIRDTWWLVR